MIGHRGAPGYLPEHTLASYQRAITQGADFIEPDLVATRDGELIARHAIDITDTTDVSAHPEFARRKTAKLIDGMTHQGWFADDFTLAEIKTLRARQPLPFRAKAFDDRYEISTLEEIIRLAQRESRRLNRVVGILPETKHPTYYARAGLPLEPRLVALLEKHALNVPSAPVIIQSFEVSNLKALRQQTPVRLMQLIDADGTAPDGKPIPSRPYDFTLSGDPRTYADFLTRGGLREIANYADGIGLWKGYLLSGTSAHRRPDSSGANTKLLTPTSLVADAHRARLFVHVWTFRNEPHDLAAEYWDGPVAEYVEYFRLGIDGVFSDFPDTAVSARALIFPGRSPRAGKPKR